jgi:GTP diphosphokinase / guanosine-3',5'-bis(diphosphate) 3'-diphosphatase
MIATLAAPASFAPNPQIMEQLDPAERKVIQNAYSQLLRSIKVEMSAEDKKLLRKAFNIAVDAHREQRRKSGEPYILHPIAVARICAEEIGLGVTAIICAILHDVVEDTPITVAQIRDWFGEPVANIVDGLTKFEKSMADENSPQAENFRKIIQYLLTDVRVVLIKLADRLHNMRTLGAMLPVKQKKIASETNYMYAPLAHRLGLYAIKTEFQDLVMQSTQPEDYAFVQTQLAQTEKDRNRYIKDFIKPLEERLRTTYPNLKFRIFGRSKSISSIWSKIKNKDIEFADIYDLFAIRVVLDVPLDQERTNCWMVYGVVTDTFNPIQDRMKDWVSVPKSNGYESLHTTVVGPKGRFVEIQIRTERMNEIAEKGFAAHWRYKGIKSDNVYDNWLNKVREMLETPNTNAVDFIDEFQRSLFQEDVFVYTPKGDMRTLPKGATALDFAFEIHTDIGYRCQSVKVNGRLVPLSYMLHNGDVVAIQTSPNQKPNDQWIKWVVTGKARLKIRNAIKDEKRKVGELGKETMERKLRHIKAHFDDANIEFLVKFYKFQSRIDMFFAIAKDQVDLQRIKELKVEGGKLSAVEKTALQIAREEVESTPQKDSKKDKILMVAGQNAGQYQYQFATCCNPLHGDAVFAYMSTLGMRIHRLDCANSEYLFSNMSHRILRAEWVEGAKQAFIANILVRGVDDMGVLQNLTNIITKKLNINIKSITIEGDAGFYEGKIKVSVFNTEQLEHLIETLAAMKGVESVARKDEF